MIYRCAPLTSLGCMELLARSSDLSLLAEQPKQNLPPLELPVSSRAFRQHRHFPIYIDLSPGRKATSVVSPFQVLPQSIVPSLTSYAPEGSIARQPPG